MPSDAAKWMQLSQVLDDLFDQPGANRKAALARLRESDIELAERAEKYLQAAESDDVANDSAISIAPDLLAEFANGDVKEHIGEQLGPYRISSAISRGGMGLVYRAERTDGSYEQSVAIKLMPTSIAGERSRVLFERERRLLGKLEHPNIARIMDAGISSQNIPYFVMELIDGVRVDEHVRNRTLSLNQILSLFVTLCDALVYCHQSTVIHGDLKPDNVLVDEERVRLVDFGIGQFLDDAESLGDSRALVAYTPGFAAPEQIRGEPPTVACDIYALGAVLRNLVEIYYEGNANNEKMSLDLQAVIECCLHDLPVNRYFSVDALRSDVRAILEHYPVRAREATRLYRSQKFVYRNKLIVGATVGVVISLLVGLGATYWQFQNAHDAAIRAEQANRFLTSLFQNADPNVAGETDVSLRQVIDDAAGRVANELQDSPDVRNEIYLLLGNAYFGIGEYGRALEFHERALRYWREEHSPPNINIVKVQNAIGADHTNMGEYTIAESFHRNAIEQLAALQLENSALARTSWTNLGHSLSQSDPEGTLEAMLRAHDINLVVDPTDSGAIARSLGDIAVGYRAMRNIEQSLHYHELAIELAEANSERLAPEILSIRCNLALDYGTLGRYLEAREAQLECNHLTAERLGSEHPANVSNLNNLGALDLALGHLQDAERIYLKALAIAERKLPPKSLERMAVEINYAVVNWHSGRTAEAEGNLRDILVRMEESVGADHAAAGRVRGLLGRVILQRGDVETAQRFIENSLGGLIPYWRSDALLWRAEVMLALGENDAAEKYALQSLEIRRELPHYIEWQVAEAEWALAVARNDEQMISRCRDIFITSLPPEHFRRASLQ